MGTLESWLMMKERQQRYEYSDRWTIEDGVVKKLVWIPVYEFTIRYDTHTDLDSVKQMLDEWHNSAEAKWIKTNASEDIRFEQRDLFDHDTFQSTISVKIMARFYEETYVIYLLKWK